MKLKDEFVVQRIDKNQYLVPVGDEKFAGIIRSNKTAAFIVECLKKETTEEAIVEAMCAKYDAPREQIEEDVKEILETLRSVHALA